MFAFPHQFEPKKGQRSKHSVLGRVEGDLAQYDDSGQLRFSEEGLKHGGLGLEGLGTECLDMESARPSNARMALPVRLRARSSRTCPRRTRTVITASTTGVERTISVQPCAAGVEPAG